MVVWVRATKNNISAYWTQTKHIRAWLGVTILRLWKKLQSSGILRHFFVALSLTSMVLLAKQVGMMTFLDSLTISVSQRLLADRNDKGVSKETSGGELHEPSLIFITPEDYQDPFNNTSPLNRDKLAAGLERLFARNPEAVLIDLDLAPSTNEYQKDDYLDRVLKDAIEQHHVNLVLITPILNKVDTRAEEWLRQRCQEGIGLALPSVKVTLGIALYYSELYPSLGVVAKSFIPGLVNKGRSSELFNVCAHINLLNQSLGQKATEELGLREMYDDLFKHAYREGIAYIDWTQTKDIKAMNWKELLSAGDESLKNAFANRVVFVGSEYGPHDRFQSPVGMKRGVQTHMAVAYSHLSESHWVPYVCEILFGTVVGTLGAWCWKMHRKFRKDHLVRTAHGRLTLLDHALRFVCRGVLVILPAVIGLFFVLLFVHFSMSWLAKGVWLNPAPLVVGILLDILMLRDDAHEEAQRPAIKSGMWLCLVRHPSWLMIHGPLIVGALCLLIVE